METLKNFWSTNQSVIKTTAIVVGTVAAIYWGYKKFFGKPRR